MLLKLNKNKICPGMFYMSMERIFIPSVGSITSRYLWTELDKIQNFFQILFEIPNKKYIYKI